MAFQALNVDRISAVKFRYVTDDTVEEVSQHTYFTGYTFSSELSTVNCVCSNGSVLAYVTNDGDILTAMAECDNATPRIWNYSTPDSIATVTASGYFSGKGVSFTSIDSIKVQAADGDYEVKLSGGVASVVSGRVQTPRKTAVIWGDSITNQNVTEDATNINWTNIGYFTWLNALSGNTFELLNDAGVSGEEVSEILARFDSDVRAYNPDFVFLLAGTNDLIGSGDVDATKANLLACVNKVKSIGAKCVLGTVMAAATVNESDLYELNKFIRSLDVDYLVDFASAVTDQASTTYPCTKSSVYYDGLHPNIYGAYLMGKQAAKDMSDAFSVVNFWPQNRIDTNNFTNNPLNGGTGGTVVSGTAPDDVQVFISGSLPGGSTLSGAVSDEGSYNSFELTATGTTNFQTFTRYATKSPNPNKTYIAYVEILDCSTVDLVQLGFRLRMRDGGSDQIVLYSGRPWGAPTGVVPNAEVSGVMQTPPFQTNDDTDGFILDIFWEMKSGNLKIGRVALIEYD